jgi:hypothetical protein
MSQKKILLVLIIIVFLIDCFLVFQDHKKWSRISYFDPDQRRKTDLAEVDTALKIYKEKNNKYPEKNETSSGGKAIWAGPNSITLIYNKTYSPYDPINSAPYIYSYTTPDPKKSNDAPGASFELKAHLSTGEDFLIESP